MTTVDFEWNVPGIENLGEPLRFDPGLILEGTITIAPQANLNCNGIKVRAEWHTEGRGDRDQQKGDERIVFQGVLAGGQPVVFAFRLNLPGQPWSYTGNYINILWDLIADVDLPLAINPKSRLPIVLRPKVD
jgi:hypothetical protein